MVRMRIDLRVAFVRFNETASVQVALGAPRSPSAFREAARRIVYTGGKTDLAAGLRRARLNVFGRRAPADRPDAPNVAVVLTDGRPDTEPDRTEPEAALLKAAGCHVIPVAVARSVDAAQLRRIASDPEAPVFMPDLEQLSGRLVAVSRPVCSLIAGTGVPCVCV